MSTMGRLFCRAVLIAPVALFVLPLGQAMAQQPPLEIPFVYDWGSSPHALRSAEAFNHWNHEKEVPADCAKCHSTPGFQDYIGADGSTPWKVDGPALTGTVISCVACHNKVTRTLDHVTFPSGLLVEGIGPQARCITCHQGRESTVSVNEKMKGMEADKVDAKIRFINVHYRAAGATLFGTQAKGGYEYDGKTYVGLYIHDEDANSCVECHDPHTLKPQVEFCATCHRRTIAAKDFAKIRRSKQDFDGDGDVDEGIENEVDTLHGMLLAALQTYAKSAAGTAIGYEAHTYPYFFVDKNGDGKIDGGEAKYPNAYKTWTPRLLRAAYNYQYVAKDPGAFVHNAKYVIQLMYDSMADLGQKTKVDVAKLARP